MQIVFRGDCLTSSGYSNTNLLYVCGLIENGVNVKLVEQLDPRDEYLKFIDTRKANLLREAMDRPLEDKYIYFNRTTWDCFKPYPNAIKTFASTVWETDPFPVHWTDSMNENKEVNTMVVPTVFNKDMLEGVINKPIHVLREGLDLDVYNDMPVDREIQTTFNFLSIFQWLERKGFDVLIEAYFREFNDNDNVALIIKTSSLSYDAIPSSSMFAYISRVKRKYKKNIPVIINPLPSPYEEILNLYRNSHCFVLPTRAEGYCRPQLEAMASNLPTIITGWGGQTDFANHDNSYLINYELSQVRPQWYSGDFREYQQWAEPDINHLQHLMRHVYNNYAEAKDKAKKAKELANNYGYKEVAKDLEKILFGE